MSSSSSTTQPVLTDAVANARRLPARWFEVERTDVEVLEAVFGTGWAISRMPNMPGLDTRFWFLEQPSKVMAVAFARDYDTEHHRRGEPEPEQRRWRRAHLTYWLTRATEASGWAALLGAEANRILPSGTVSPRAVHFFAYWADRHIPDSQDRDGFITLAALGGYTNAADLIREYTPRVDAPRVSA